MDAHKVQDAFLAYLRNNGTPVTVLLLNGIKLQGVVEAFDKFSLILRRERRQLVFKHTIATIVPMTRVDVRDGERSTHQRQEPS